MESTVTNLRLLFILAAHFSLLAAQLGEARQHLYIHLKYPRDVPKDLLATLFSTVRANAIRTHQ